MRNKKLIPFEVIERAVAGEPEAIDTVLRHYTGRIKHLSTYQGHINDDIKSKAPVLIISGSLFNPGTIAKVNTESVNPP